VEGILKMPKATQLSWIFEDKVKLWTNHVRWTLIVVES